MKGWMQLLTRAKEEVAKKETKEVSSVIPATMKTTQNGLMQTMKKAVKAITLIVILIMSLERVKDL